MWKQKGQFTEFGANISGPNKGRYGYNLFANGTTYMAGCSMEIGETSCRQQRPNDVAKGDLISIIIGEGGTMVNGGRPAQATSASTGGSSSSPRPDAAEPKTQSSRPKYDGARPAGV